MESKELLIVRQTRPKKGSRRKMTTVKILFVIGVLSSILITQSGCSQGDIADMYRMTQLMGGITDMSDAATALSNSD